MFTQLRRITSSGNYIPEIDGVRFVAIAMVLVEHLHQRILRGVEAQYQSFVGSTVDRILLTCGVGVMIFFALSGYILHSILRSSLVKRGALDLKHYYLRRVTRLEPPYIIVTTIIFTVLTLGLYHGSGKYLGHGDVPYWESYVATIFYLNGLLFGTPPSVNPPGWTLEIEVQFYIMAPLLTFCLLKMKSWQARITVLLAAMAAWGLFKAYLATPNPHLSYSLLLWIPYFLVGFIVFELINRSPRKAILPPGVIDFLAVAALITLLSAAGPWEQVEQCACIGVFLYGALAGSWLRRLLQWRWLTNIGGMCYTIYLIHLPCIEILAKATTHLKLKVPYLVYLFIQGLVVLPAVLLIATVFFLLVERPCMDKNWPFKLWAFVKSRVSSSPAMAAHAAPEQLDK